MKKFSKTSIAISVAFSTQMPVSAQVSNLDLTDSVRNIAAMPTGGSWTSDAAYNDDVKNVKNGTRPKHVLFKNPLVTERSFSTIGPSGSVYQKIHYFVSSTSVDVGGGKIVYGVPKTGVIDIADSGSGFVIIEGVIQGVKYLRSPEFNPPGTAAVSSCRSKKSSITDSVAIGTIATTMVQKANSLETSQDYSNKLTETIGVDSSLTGGGIGVSLKTSQTWEASSSYGRKNNMTTTNAWTDTNSFTHTFTSTTAIPGGVTVVPTVTTPLVEIYGRFKMGAIFQPNQNKALITKEKDVITQYQLYTGESLNRFNGNSVWTGKIVVPASQLNILGQSGLLTVSHWFAKEIIMSVPFYVKQCPTDIVTKNYAEVMKPALCKIKDSKGKLVYPTACN